MPTASARVCTTATVCGRQASETKKRSLPFLAMPWLICMASAAAVASSSSEALVQERPVRSITMVWKLSSASSRPWEISG